MLKKTSLNAVHHDMGARMVDFGGWDMPVMYSNQMEEHHAVRKAAGLFDVSHMGEILIEGPQSFDLVQKLVSRDIKDMAPGRVSLGVMCTEEGGIIDDLTIYKFNDQKYLLVVNAGTTDGDLQWCEQWGQGMDLTITNISEDITKLDLQGPKAEQILQALTVTDLKSIKRYHFKVIQVDNVEMIISRSGYTGEDGFELYFPNEHAEHIWKKLLEGGAPHGLIACGLGSRDTLRTECGMMLYGHDIDTQHTPLEAVYGWAVSLDKDFIGRDALLRQKREGLKRKLVGFEMVDRGIAREHYAVFHDGQQVGEVTSGTPSPTLGKNIGMAYVPSELAKPGTTLQIQVRDNLINAVVTTLPFYKK